MIGPKIDMHTQSTGHLGGVPNRDWWVITDRAGTRAWKVLPLPHPQYRKKENRDAIYASAAGVIDEMRSARD